MAPFMHSASQWNINVAYARWGGLQPAAGFEPAKSVVRKVLEPQPTTGRPKRPPQAKAHPTSVVFFTLVFTLFTVTGWAQLPEGPGKAETQKLCSSCHELAKSVSIRQDREGWQSTLDKMMKLGVKGTDQEFAAILDYL